jgi:hypothetical protein
LPTRQAARSIVLWSQPVRRCALKFGAADCAGGHGLDFDQCITAVESRNAQHNRASDPFRVGLYFTQVMRG